MNGIVEFLWPLYVFFGLPISCALFVILGFFAFLIVKAFIDVVILKKDSSSSSND